MIPFRLVSNQTCPLSEPYADIVALGICALAETISCADMNAPLTDSIVLILASDCKLRNLGAATTAKIPKITITTTSSISVKPRDFIVFPYLALTVIVSRSEY